MIDYKFLLIPVAIMTVIYLTGCSTVKIDDYSNEKPTLIMENYFNGTIDAHGYFKDRKGLITKRFSCVIVASWKEGVGTLDESFTYSDGTTSKRIWTLQKKGSQYYGTASDVHGEAIGNVAGNSLRWTYYLNLPVDGKTYTVYFDDWMHLLTDKVMLNQSKMSKWGIHLGEVTLTFTKR